VRFARKEDRAMDRHGYFFEDLSLGMSRVFSKTITEADLLMFAGVSGDTNPIHLDQDFASRTMFEGRIAHGMLTASLVSTVLGTRLPGPGAIYVSQSLRFLAPVRIGDTVIARASVAELMPERNRVRMHTICTVGERKVLDGEAVLMVPRKRNSA
jgi:3-hydroxybutyryl-CoA dehydratase